jgi:hypothetical protein
MTPGHPITVEILSLPNILNGDKHQASHKIMSKYHGTRLSKETGIHGNIIVGFELLVLFVIHGGHKLGPIRRFNVNHHIFNSQCMGGMFIAFVWRDRYGNDCFRLGRCTWKIGLIIHGMGFKVIQQQKVSKNTMAFSNALIIPSSLVVISSSFMQGGISQERIMEASNSSASNNSNTSWASTIHNGSPSLIVTGGVQVLVLLDTAICSAMCIGWC